MKNENDMVVVSETAANISARILLVAMNKGTTFYNPAIESITKGVIVHEINAIGEYLRIFSGKGMFQFHILNKPKWIAIRSSCSKKDYLRFSEKWRLVIEDSKSINSRHVPRETL